MSSVSSSYCRDQMILRPASAFSLWIYEQYDSPKLDQFLREHVDGYTMHYCINFDDVDVIFCVVTQKLEVDPPWTWLPLIVMEPSGVYW